jgi:hypothetical protein
LGTLYCKHLYRVVVTGPLSVPPATLADVGTAIMANALGLNPLYGDVTCTAYNNMLAFCSYWGQAKMCYAYPYSQLEPYLCSFE